VKGLIPGAVGGKVDAMKSVVPFFLLLAAWLWRPLPLLANSFYAQAMPTPEVGGFNPGLGIAAVIIVTVMFVAFLLLMGMGLAAGIVVCALAGALTAFGILSSTVAIGFIRRSPASALRALFVQLGAAAGIPCGICAMWLVSWLADTHWSIARRLLGGSVCGLVCGVAVALLFNFAWGRVTGWLLKQCAPQS
jgi:hypothetical protein